MKEKEGNIIKLYYDFDTSKCLEIEYKPNTWIRVTSRMFRSFDGNRRIQSINYDGPIYVFGTNRKVEQNKLNKIIGEMPECKRRY